MLSGITGPSGLSAIYDGGDAIFDPLTLTSLVGWWRPESAKYQDTSDTLLAESQDDPVHRWKDDSGNGNDIDIQHTSYVPVLKLNEINGLQSVYFDSSGDGASWPQFEALVKGSLLGAQPITAHAVYHVVDEVIGGSDWAYIASFDGSNFNLVYRHSADKHFLSANGLTNSVSVAEAPGQYTYTVALCNATSSKLRVRGVEATGNIGSNSGLHFGIPRRNIKGTIKLYMAEMAIQQAAATDDEVAGMESYFVSKYGF